MSAQSIWDVLGIAATGDGAAIRRAYARKLKTTQPEDDPEGFKQLRAAYEAALQIASEPAAAPNTSLDAGASPAPAAASDAAPEHAAEQVAPLESELLQLRRALTGLARSLRSCNELPADAYELLSQVLAAPALDNIHIEQQVEIQVAELLARTIPRSDPLLQRVAQRFGWYKDAHRLEGAPLAVVARLRDLEFLASLAAPDSPHAAAFATLQRPPVPVLSWLLAHAQRPHRVSGHQLLALLRDRHPALLQLLDAHCIEWWDRLSTRPQPSLLLLVVGVMLTGLSCITTFSLPAAERSIAPPLMTAAAAAVAVAWKLLMIDWPRLLIQRRWPLGAPFALKIGWLPLAIGSALLATLPLGRALPAGLSLLALQWTLIAVRPIAFGRIRRPNLATLLIVFGPGACLSLWWWLTAQEFPATLRLQLLLPVLLLLLTSALGLWEAQASWVFDLSSRQRQTALAVLFAWGTMSVAALWWLAPAAQWRPLCAVLLLSLMCLQRPLHITHEQLRWLAAFVPGLGALWWVLNAIYLLALGEPPALQAHANAFTVLGLSFVSLVTLTVCFAWKNETAGVVTRIARGG